MDKKEARQAVLSILDNHCTPCTRTNGLYSEKKNKFCRDNCDIYKELRNYGEVLYKENKPKPNPIRLEEPKNRGVLSEDEKAYLIAHVPVHGISHVAKKLNRTVNSVYNMYERLIKTSNSAK